MSVFTPGPWKVVGPVGFVFTEGDAYGHGEMHIAQVRGWGHLTGRGGGCAFDEDKAIAIQEANARLIAAAPDLLAALSAIVEQYGPWHDDDCPGDDTCACSAKPFHDAINAAIRKAEGR